jgi:hypothetical protein
VTTVLHVCLMASHKWWYFTQVYIIPKSISLSLSLKISWKNQEYDSFGLSQILLRLVNVGLNSSLYLLSKHSMEIKDHIHYCWKSVFRNYRHLGGTTDKSSVSKILEFLGTSDTTSVLPIWRLWRSFLARAVQPGWGRSNCPSKFSLPTSFYFLSEISSIPGAYVEKGVEP